MCLRLNLPNRTWWHKQTWDVGVTGNIILKGTKWEVFMKCLKWEQTMTHSDTGTLFVDLRCFLMFICRFIMLCSTELRQTVCVSGNLCTQTSVSQIWKLCWSFLSKLKSYTVLCVTLVCTNARLLTNKTRWGCHRRLQQIQSFVSPLNSLALFFVMMRFNTYISCFSALLIWSDCVGYSAVQLDHVVSVGPLRTLSHHPRLFLLCFVSACHLSSTGWWLGLLQSHRGL